MNRPAGIAPLQALKNWRIAGMSPELSRMLGLGTLGAAVAAASQLFGTDAGPAEDVGGVLGAGLGAYPGAAAGGIAGGLLGGGGRGSRIGRPVGALTGALIGGGFGREAGTGLARQVTGQNEDPMLKQARTVAKLEAERAALLLPTQTQQAQMALQTEIAREQARAQIEQQLMAQQLLASAALNGQANTAALQQQLLAGVLS